MLFFAEKASHVVGYFGTNEINGLSTEAAVGKIGQYGENRLAEKKKTSDFRKFLAQFADVMILILLAAAAISFLLAFYSGEKADYFEPILILIIVVVNAFIGVIQEKKAEKALEALRNLSAPLAKVIRDGNKQRVDAVSLVPGDILFLESGDIVPADARLIECSGLKCDESALSGESVPAEKNAFLLLPANAPLGDRHNMVFSGCTVTTGTAKAVVTATGMDTEMGKIAHLLNTSENDMTPLQKKLAELGKKLGILALIACAVIFAVGVGSGIPVLEIFMTSVSLAVSAIPEGLPAIVTIVLALGVERMAGRNALIRHLPAVETLGSASVICTDKTGTLTQNRMTLTAVYTDAEKRIFPFSERRQNHSDMSVKLLRYAALCCNGKIVHDKNGERRIGDPTETAILSAAEECGFALDELEKPCVRLAEIPFDSERKRMTVICRMEGKLFAIVKGAFDGMLPLFRAGDILSAQNAAEAMGKDALRVLAVGYRELPFLPKNPLEKTADIEKDLILLGLVGMIDPPRKEAAEAVALCKKAGIRPILITGDHPATAKAIAKQTGILSDGQETLTGEQLAKLDDHTLEERVGNVCVYARVSPGDKLRIVQALQARDEVVAMTGDGVNDAPALGKADIGCAMGKTGTDVAKGASDMIFTDDNFATIVEAVREGRGIYANIRKVVAFLLGTNIGEVITVFVSMIYWHKMPLLSMQLLWINLVTDGLPAVALGMEKVEREVMDVPPKPKKEGLFAHGLGVRVLLQGLMFGFLTLFGFWVAENSTGLAGGRTLAFMVLSLSQIVQAYNMRSERSLFHIGLFTNRKLNGAAALSVLLVAMVLFTHLRKLFGLVLLPLPLYGLGIALILTPFAVTELSKAVRRLLK